KLLWPLLWRADGPPTRAPTPPPPRTRPPPSPPRSTRASSYAPPLASVSCWRRFDSGTRALTMPTIRDRRAYLLCVRSGEAIEIGVPLPRQEGLLRRVAVLAGGHDVGPDGFPPTDQGHHVVEGEPARTDIARAVVAAAHRDPPLPPSARAKLARPHLLAPDPRIVSCGHESLGRAHAPLVAAASCAERSSHSLISQATWPSASLRARAISRARSPSR